MPSLNRIAMMQTSVLEYCTGIQRRALRAGSGTSCLLAKNRVAVPSHTNEPSGSDEKIASAIECYARHAAAVAAHQSAIARTRELINHTEALHERLRLAAESRERARIHRAELRALIEQYVEGLRAAGEPPERVIALVKTEVSVMIRRLPRDAPLPIGDTITAEIAQWAILAYYAA
jgi:hypothetical protein